MQIDSVTVFLLLGTHQIDLKDIFKFELASFSASLFDEFGNARYPKNKSTLMNKLKEEQSKHGLKYDAFIIDGGGLLYKVYLPTKGTVKDLVDGVENYLRKLSTDGDVIIVFDTKKTVLNQIQETHAWDPSKGVTNSQ